MQSDLTRDQRAFLIRHKLSPLSVFDASGMTRREYGAVMKQQEKLFATGTTPCRAAGHTLRDRAGHCIECSTSNIAFIQRYFAESYVYIASSSSIKKLKIGCSKDTLDRTRTINGFAYGGANDWKMIASVKCKNAGRVEFATHAVLAQYASAGTYRTNGRDTVCREMFVCDYQLARDALLAQLGPDERARLKKLSDVGKA